MALISLEFGFFFCGFFAIWWLFRRQPVVQNALLTITSWGLLAFYTNLCAVTCLLGFTLAIWLFSRAILAGGKHRKSWLAAGIGLAVLNLVLWKYAEYFRPVLRHHLAGHGIDPVFFESDWLLPLGISYYTFQGIAYLVSCYERGQEERLSLWELLGFLGLFLTLTSGPIARSQDDAKRTLLSYDGRPCGARDQIRARGPRRVLSPYLALTFILLAIFKKWLLAGWLADLVVKPVFNNPQQYHSLDILAAIYGYTLQLFFDFSGYSELVLGLGMLLGLRLPVNFRTPLLAPNLRDFWNRWHISLSTWIRDYIYIPLGGSKKGFLRTQINLLIAMGLSGAWHGPSGNFVLWGLLHGAGLVFLNCLKKLTGKPAAAGPSRWQTSLPGRMLGVFITSTFVCFAFVLFGAGTLDDAWAVFQALFANTAGSVRNPATVWMLAGIVLLWFTWPLLRGLPEKFAAFVDQIPMILRPVPLFLSMVLVVIYAPSGMPDFIYANF